MNGRVRLLSCDRDPDRMGPGIHDRGRSLTIAHIRARFLASARRTAACELLCTLTIVHKRVHTAAHQYNVSNSPLCPNANDPAFAVILMQYCTATTVDRIALNLFESGPLHGRYDFGVFFNSKIFPGIILLLS